MDSLISRTGKLRSLARELETKFDDAAATSCPSRMSQHSAKIHSTTSAPFHRPANQYQSQPTAEVHQFLEDADPKGRWCIWHVHECMVQGWSRGVLHGGAAQFTLIWKTQNTKKKIGFKNEHWLCGTNTSKFRHRLTTEVSQAGRRENEICHICVQSSKGLNCQHSSVKLPSSNVQWHRPMRISPSSESPWLAQVRNGQRSGDEDQDCAVMCFQ